MSIGQVGPAGKAGDYYTHQDNYYVLGSMDERWVGQGRKPWAWQVRWTLKTSWRCWKASCRTAVT